MKLNNLKKIEAMQQISAKKNEKNEKAKLLNLRKISNQIVFFQRMFFDDKIKLKRRFKFLIIALIKNFNCFFKKDVERIEWVESL